ncbi:hypothetical protein BC826DRAFT_292867 [Russula brevipes]|nr:hypothetical protein BC826DRAFT_292867 [Russula brevipes]
MGEIEYCKVCGYPFPRFFDALDDSENADGPGGAAARYKVWVVLGEERLELPRTYAAIEEGEEKMARKVLRRGHGWCSGCSWGGSQSCGFKTSPSPSSIGSLQGPARNGLPRLARDKG